MNEKLANEIRKTIESVKDLKLQVGGINNYLSILEGLIRADCQKQVDEAYQRGYDKGYADKTNNDEVCKDLAKDIYQRGLNDAWEAARKLFSSMADSDIEKAFPTEWNNGGFHALINLQPQEAIEKLKAYEEKQKAEDEIRVGDVVMIKQFKHPENHLFVVTKVSDESVWGVEGDGSWNYWAINEVIKTDKHFDIASILEDMRND